MNLIKKIINSFKAERLKNPIKHCALYKDDECCFVDGPMCNYPNCSMLDDYLFNVYKRRIKDE